MIQKRLELILKEVAKRHDKPYAVVLEVYMSEFQLVRDTLRSLEFKTIKLPGFGKYIASNKKTIEFKDYLLKKLEYDKSRSDKNTPIQGQE
jgi:hypothetical protein